MAFCHQQSQGHEIIAEGDLIADYFYICLWASSKNWLPVELFLCRCSYMSFHLKHFTLSGAKSVELSCTSMFCRVRVVENKFGGVQLRTEHGHDCFVDRHHVSPTSCILEACCVYLVGGLEHFIVGGLEHFFVFHILGIIIPSDFHIFQRGGSTTNQLWIQGYSRYESCAWVLLVLLEHSRLFFSSSCCWPLAAPFNPEMFQ